MGKLATEWRRLVYGKLSSILARQEKCKHDRRIGKGDHTIIFCVSRGGWPDGCAKVCDIESEPRWGAGRAQRRNGIVDRF